MLTTIIYIVMYWSAAQWLAPREVSTAAPIYKGLRRRFPTQIANAIWLPQGAIAFVLIRLFRLIRRAK